MTSEIAASRIVRPLTTTALFIVSALLALTCFGGCNAAFPAGAEESETRNESPTGLRELCDSGRTGVSVAKQSWDLELPADSELLLNRPWIRDCVIARNDQLNDPTLKFCGDLERIDPEDPLARELSDDALQVLLRAFRSLLKSCHFETSSAALMMEDQPHPINEMLAERVQREWCYDQTQTIRRVRRNATSLKPTAKQNACLEASLASLESAVSESCTAQWIDPWVGARVASDWLAACNIDITGLDAQP